MNVRDFLAEQAGLSQQMISYVERGMRNPTLETLLRVAHVLWKIIKRASETLSVPKT